jgi:hypothetical protein
MSPGNPFQYVRITADNIKMMGMVSVTSKKKNFCSIF